MRFQTLSATAMSIALLSAPVVAFPLLACDGDKGTVEEAVEEVQDEVEDATDEVKDEIDDAT